MIILASSYVPAQVKEPLIKSSRSVVDWHVAGIEYSTNGRANPSGCLRQEIAITSTREHTRQVSLSIKLDLIVGLFKEWSVLRQDVLVKMFCNSLRNDLVDKFWDHCTIAPKDLEAGWELDDSGNPI